jgi:hypothetical protein
MSKPPRPAPQAPDMLNMLVRYFELRELEDETVMARRQITRQILERKGLDMGLDAGRSIAAAADKARAEHGAASTSPTSETA